MPQGPLNQQAAAFLQYLCSKFCTWNQTLNVDVANLTHNMQWNMPTIPPINTTTEEQPVAKQKDALLYIVVVLMFYSFGMITMLIGYVKRERKDQEEERYLQNFLKTPPPTVRTHRGCSGGKLALHALNAASSIPQPSTSKGKVTFV